MMSPETSSGMSCVSFTTPLKCLHRHCPNIQVSPALLISRLPIRSFVPFHNNKFVFILPRIHTDPQASSG
ncbi:hypothetical protein E2C01_003830 [Portunus trituberculatus]|uniref:Uncharacterized protein n=1 Tax=Portunus trituberculatus TaxID=210409 RepID=A0A5B7CQT5_PORTR|nr:hypothetical protein [Portunus trituberculatus]